MTKYDLIKGQDTVPIRTSNMDIPRAIGSVSDHSRYCSDKTDMLMKVEMRSV